MSSRIYFLLPEQNRPGESRREADILPDAPAD